VATFDVGLDSSAQTRRRFGESLIVTGPGETTVVDVATPAVGPRDVLVKMRACGICGTDLFYISAGGLPPRQGKMPLGHEPAGEVVDVGSDVTGVSVGDHASSTNFHQPHE